MLSDYTTLDIPRSSVVLPKQHGKRWSKDLNSRQLQLISNSQGNGNRLGKPQGSKTINVLHYITLHHTINLHYTIFQQVTSYHIIGLQLY